MSTPLSLRVKIVATALLFTAVGCASDEPPSPTTVSVPLPAMSSDVLEQRGTLISSNVKKDLSSAVADRVGEVRTVVYRSVSGYDGEASEVSGTMFVPPGAPPDGGWPVISYAHATTGLTEDCGPSLSPDLLGYANALVAVVESGFAVAMTDFQGLGHAGVHPYLEPRTAAFNVIDAVRALRETFPDVSTQWLAVGTSQGGQAAWAANEYSRDYGADLDFRGSVSLAPPADITGFAQAAQTQELTAAQMVFLPLIVNGLKVTHPDLVEDNYVRGPAAKNMYAFMSCTASDAEKQELGSQLDSSQVTPVSQEATDQLATWLAENSLPQRGASGPMLVINGSDDDLVLPEWVAAAVSRACAMGDTVLHREMSGQAHADVDGGNSMYQWMIDRFTDSAAPSNCA